MSRERAEQLIEAGIWLDLAGDGEGAQGLFRRALRLDPGNARASSLLRGPSTQGPVAAPVLPSPSAEVSPQAVEAAPAEPEPPWVAVSELQTSELQPAAPATEGESSARPEAVAAAPADRIWDTVAPSASVDAPPQPQAPEPEGVRVVVAAAHAEVAAGASPPPGGIEGDWGALAGEDDGTFAPAPLTMPPAMFGAPPGFDPSGPAPRTTMMQFMPRPGAVEQAPAPRSTLMQFRPAEVALAAAAAASAPQPGLPDLGNALSAAGPLLAAPPSDEIPAREETNPQFVLPPLDQLVPPVGGPGLPAGIPLGTQIGAQLSPAAVAALRADLGGSAAPAPATELPFDAPPVEPAPREALFAAVPPPQPSAPGSHGVSTDLSARGELFAPAPLPMLSPQEAQPAWAWSNSPPPDVLPSEWAAAPEPRPSPRLAPSAESAWDQRTNPGIKLEEVEGRGRALDLISSDSKITRPPAERTAELGGLLRRAKDLLGLDDHTGAMELILKAQAIAPDDLEVQMLRERSERTLLTMFESKLGRLEATPRVLLKDDEIIWLNLDHRAGFVLAQIDGAVSFEDLFSVSGMSRLDTARILAQLVDEGVITRG